MIYGQRRPSFLFKGCREKIIKPQLPARSVLGCPTTSSRLLVSTRPFIVFVFFKLFRNDQQQSTDASGQSGAGGRSIEISTYYQVI